MTMMTPHLVESDSGLGSADPTAEKSRLDRIGVVASVACAIHCLVAPLLMLMLPVTGSIWSHWSVHWVLAVLVLPLACWVIFCGYRKHGKRLTLVAAGLGAALIVAGLILPMMKTGLGVSASLPAWLGSGPVAAGAGEEHAACADTCCPSVVPDHATGGLALVLPAGGLTTLVGSLLLVLAHGTNLWSCRCFAKRSDGAEPPNGRQADCCRA